MSAEDWLRVIMAGAALVGLPALVKTLLPRLTSFFMGRAERSFEVELEATKKALEEKYATSQYNRKRDAFVEDKTFDLLEGSIEMLANTVEAQEKRADRLLTEMQRVYRALDQIQNTLRIQNGILYEFQETLRSMVIRGKKDD